MRNPAFGVARRLAPALVLGVATSSAIGCSDDALPDLPDLAQPAPPADLAQPPPPRDLAEPDLASVDLAPYAWGIESRPANPTCVAPARPPSAVGAQFVAAFPNLRFTVPVFMTQAPGDAARWFVVEKRGVVRTFANDEATAAATNFVDITGRVNAAPNEAGLLGMAFHPKWQQNRYVYLSYTARCPQGRAACAGSGLLSTVSRFTSMDNGGGIGFAPDGLLYLGFGDGGSGGDPHGPIGNGQEVNVLLGKMLRIDVDGGDPYAIPADNPFAGGGGKPEIYAWGLRNPWRWSFDRKTGDLWVGDVGQNAWEEIDRVRRGGNYGWRVMEGFHCYNPMNCNQNGFDLPVVEYSHGQGLSVTGGYVYRGAAVPRLVGTYIYGDYSSGSVWALLYDAMGRPAPAGIAGGTGMTSFGEGNDGELFLVGANGRLYKLVSANPGMDTIPKKLSLTGCFDPLDAKKPLPMLIPYDVASPLWSDGAEKHRFFALPDNTRITVSADGDFELPVGSVAVKEFRVLGKRVETRLLVRHADGEWAGYTYRWDEQEGDADLLAGSESRDLGGGRSWYYPSRAECLACHTAAAGRSLGLEVAQQNTLLDYPSGRRANQLATFDHLGFFTAPLGDPAQKPALPPPVGTAPLEQRARSYLHANCSFCHRPNSTGRGDADLRYATPTAMARICDAVPTQGTLGLMGARLLLPGDPARSVLSLRMHATDVRRMPPLGVSIVDGAGVQVVDDWIRSLAACP